MAYYERIPTTDGWERSEVSTTESPEKGGSTIVTSSIIFEREGLTIFIGAQETKDHPDGATQMIVQIERVR
jgi:hypothetical protein